MKASAGILALAAIGLLPLSAMAADTAAPAAKSKVEIRCESTGSRIRRDKVENCAKAAQPVTNYYRSDLDRTSQTDVGKSLRELDPRIQ